jgi:hypothetical protein
MTTKSPGFVVRSASALKGTWSLNTKAAGIIAVDGPVDVTEHVDNGQRPESLA